MTKKNTSIYVIGNGGSLRGFDFHTLDEFDSIGMNAAFRHWHRIDWYPTYYICMDTVMIETHKKEIKKLITDYNDRIQLFFVRKKILEFYPDLGQLPHVFLLEDYQQTPFFVGLDPLITTGSFAPLFAAMLGYRKMYLMGIDLNHIEMLPESKHVHGNILEITETPVHNPNYFFDDYQRKGELYNIPSGSPGLHYKSWMYTKNRLSQFGVDVLNANKNSKLDIFDFGSILPIVQVSSTKAIPPQPKTRKNGSVVFYGMNPRDGFSGGRYHAWMMAEAAAEAGWEVAYITNHHPSFYKDFDDEPLYPAHHHVKVYICNIISNECVLPDIECDVLIVIPHNNCHGSFVKHALRFADVAKSRVALLNFESANWFNAFSPVKRDEKNWDGWKQIARHACTIFSLAAEGSKYAKKFYTDVSNNAEFDYLWPTINTRIADSIPFCEKEKRIIVFARFSHAEHKGVNLIKDILSEELKGYSLVFIVGIGNIDKADLEVLEQAGDKYDIKLEFLSQISEKEKWRQLKRASLMIYLSFFEGFGLPPVEAQYAGTPCVAFDLPVLREVSGDNIHFVETGDLEAVKRTITKVLGSKIESHLLKASIGPRVGYESFLKRVDQLLGRIYSLTSHFCNKSCKDNPSSKQREKNKAANLPLLASVSRCVVDLGRSTIMVNGWTLPAEDDIQIKVLIDGRFSGYAHKGWSRPDILKKHSEYAENYAGWEYFAYQESNQPARVVDICVSREGNVLKKIRAKVEFVNSKFSKQKRETAEDFYHYWEALKDAYKGKRGFVIGNGPSLRISDLDSLANEITIASNKVFLAYPETNWRPTLYTLADALVIEKTKDVLPQICDMIHIPDKAVSRFDGHSLRLWRDLGATSEDPADNNTVSSDLQFGAYAGHTITFFNVQLAIHLGLNPIYLVGCDHYYAGENDSKADQLVESKVDNHFIKDYRQSGEVVNAAPIERMTLAYKHLKTYGDRHGVEIINATRGGHLEVFHRADFDKVLHKHQASPKVSICVPVLNGMPFLDECLESIKRLQYEDFEVIICDGYSDDGSYELLSKFAKFWPRCKLFRRQPQGIYDGINACIKESLGEYIYILMSDDMVYPDCLREMAGALDESAHCGICQCALEVIDSEGNATIELPKRWESRPSTKFLGRMSLKRHVRLKPHDAIAMFGVGSMYTSLTQILVRRTVYDQVGLFKDDYRSFGDLEWQMRAAVEFSCVFLPEKLAYWRRHVKQASQQDAHIIARREGVFQRIGDEHYARLCERFPLISQALAGTGLHKIYENDCKAVRLGEKKRKSYEDLDQMIRSADEIGLDLLCYSDLREPPSKDALVDKLIDPKDIYGKSVGSRITDDLILRSAIANSLNKKKQQVAYFPRFSEDGNLTNHYHRAVWYCPVETGVLEEVVIGVTAETLRVGDRPAYMCAPRQQVNVRIISDTDEYAKALGAAKIILIWRPLTEAEKLSLEKLKVAIWDITTNDPNSKEYGVYCKIHWWLMTGKQQNRLLEESYERFRMLVSETQMKAHYSATVFCTGPSIDTAFEYDFSKSFNVACNTVVASKELMNHIKPKIITAGDVVSHFGVSRYAERFRADLTYYLLNTDCYFFTTAAYGNLFRIQYPEVAHKVILCHAKIKGPNFNLLENWGLPFLDSTLNIHMIPIVSTVFNDIFIIGADGKNPAPEKNEDFWPHSKFAHYHDLVETGHMSHPTFDVNRQKETHNGYINSVADTLNIGETQFEKKYYTISPSYTDGLRERFISKSWLRNTGKGPLPVSR